jgi:hypothetical protein
VQITIHITEESTTDQLKAARALLNSLLGDEAVGSARVTVPDWPQETAPAEAEKPKRTRRTKAEIEADKAAEAEEPEEVEEAKPAAKKAAAKKTDDSNDEKAYLKEALALATRLVAASKTPEVKVALGKLDVKRVGDVPEEHVDSFMDDLREIEATLDED